MKQFGERLLTRTTKHVVICFLDGAVRVATLLDPQFAFVETTLNANDWWKIYQRLADRKCESKNHGPVEYGFRLNHI